MFYSLCFLILPSTILLTVGELSKILLMDCGKRLHGIAETSKKDERTVVCDKKINLTQNIILKNHGNCAEEVVLKNMLRVKYCVHY
jgi:hypothetical protein